ncbi:hypothetical protein CLOM_g3878 [Closterium sp. NIES-68]|nr:hypothetical protein CLOM_g3878 [Closterium sp. NIES-68]GJP66838.1 hypothetical protein CLOP_g23726 [Closterium sp. NIES-67]
MATCTSCSLSSLSVASGTASLRRLQRPAAVPVLPARRSVAVRAAKLPAGVPSPKVEPNIPKPFWGFTENAETWNSRAAMIGLIGITIVEAIARKGILELLGLEIGNGLDLPF